MISTAEQSKKFQLEMIAQNELNQSFTYPLTILAKAGEVTSANMPIADGAHFQMLGYNGEYDDTTDHSEALSVRFSQKTGNRVWSSDFEPLKSICTPGVRSAANSHARYGYRQFPGLLRANDQLVAQINNTSNQDLEVTFTFIGVLWFIGNN